MTRVPLGLPAFGIFRGKGNTVSWSIFLMNDSRQVRSTSVTARSDAFEAIHSAAQGLFSVGVIDKTAMQEFDEACLVPPDPKKHEYGTMD
jgi:hypothetical protein